MKIAVDIDDTLNIVNRVARAGAYIERKGLPFHIKDENSNMFLHVFDWKIEDVDAFMHDGGISAFTEADVRPFAREVLEAWRQEGDEIIILTARKKNWFGNPEKLSRDWLEKRRIPYDEIVADIDFVDKAHYCAEHGIDILIEDNLDACLEAQRLGVHAVLAVGKHNVVRAKEIAFGGANWKQIDAAVRFIKTAEGNAQK